MTTPRHTAWGVLFLGTITGLLFVALVWGAVMWGLSILQH